MAMYRYMALMWDRGDGESERAANLLAAKLHEVSPHKWSRAWDSVGLAIYHSGEHKGRMQTYRLKGGRGAVLGRLFRNDYSSVVDDFDEFGSRKCLETSGQHLIDEYWGRYVAFLNDPETGTRYVMRDPSGAFPCYSTEFRGVTIFFSDMQDAANFEFLRFTVNWEVLKVNVAAPWFQNATTCLNEVSEVLPAERVEVTPFEKRSRFVWDPIEVSQTDVVENPEEAAELLRETVKCTIGALAGCYDHVVLNLGGLDSSIALACMAQAANRPEIACITHYTKSPRGEERRYSRQIANKYDVPLVEAELDHRKADLAKLFAVNKCTDPTKMLMCMDLTGADMELAVEHGAQALFTGVGGDNVFHQHPSNFGALDYVRHHGMFRKSILRVAMEASRRGHKSLFATLRDMAQERFAPSPCYSYVRDRMYQDIRTPFINPEITEEKHVRAFVHPLLMPDSPKFKGKYLQILMSAYFNLGYYDCWDTEYFAERVHAYLTQPIVETCLRIPIWVLTYRGVERGLARKAFWRDLPPDIAGRYSKSTPGEFYRDIFEHNLPFYRDVLEDSVMADQGILLGDKLAQALKNKDQFLHLRHGDMLRYAAAEIWLKGWLDRPVVRAEQSKAAM